MTAEEKDVLGEVMIAAALDDLQARFEATADASVATTAGGLLAEYTRDTGRPPPELLADHRAWIDHARGEPEPMSAVFDDASPPIVSSGEDEPWQPPPDRAPPRRPSDRAAPVLIGLGVAAAIGGAVMIATGAPLHRRAERTRDEALTDPRFLALDPQSPDTRAYVAGVDAHVEREQLRTRALVGAGSVLLTAGVGVAIYGAVRLARHRSAATRPSARVHPIPGGIAF